MATSGVYAYSVTATDIIRDALETVGVLAAGEAPAAEDVLLCIRKLNMLVKQWSGNRDFSPGLKMWTRRTGYLFLQKGQARYALGPGGDHAAESYVKAKLATGVVGGASSITVENAAGITAGMHIGIRLDDGTLQWSRVDTVLGNAVDLDDALTGDASSGAVAFAYASPVVRPEEIETALIRDLNGLDVPVDVSVTLEDYQRIPVKDVPGMPDAAYFEAQRTQGLIYLNRTPDDVTQVLVYVHLVPVQNIEHSSDEVDFPAEWFRPLAAQLAIDIAPAMGRPVTAEMKLIRDEALAMAKQGNPRTTTLFFQPYADGEA